MREHDAPPPEPRPTVGDRARWLLQWLAGYGRPIYWIPVSGTARGPKRARRLGWRRNLHRQCPGGDHQRVRALDRGYRLGAHLACRRCWGYKLDWPNRAIGRRVWVSNWRARIGDWWAGRETNNGRLPAPRSPMTSERWKEGYEERWPYV